MTQFYFVLTNPEAESLLKLEISLRFPDFKLSYSRPGFLTFKSTDSQVFNPYMARVSGKCLGKFKFDELNFDKAWVWKANEELEIPSALNDLSDKSLFKIGEKVTLIMMLGADEFWVGEYLLKSTHFQTPGEVSSIQEKEVPSRAYYKIAEASEAFDLEYENEQIVLELGSAPGGATQFLLEQDLRVIGVDPAEMDPQILKQYNFKHWKKPFETLTEADFKNDVDWIVSDVNLPPTVVLNQVQRLLNFLNPIGLVLTLKLHEVKHLTLLLNVVQNFRSKGFKRVELKYLPSHRKEIALIALRS
jgi:23S rRNA (cytidine2498-2'-O)-methyltransferase